MATISWICRTFYTHVHVQEHVHIIFTRKIYSKKFTRNPIPHMPDILDGLSSYQLNALTLPVIGYINFCT